jgi:acetate kinase
MRVMVVNAGSSSMKLDLLDGDDALEQHAVLAVGPAGLDAGQLADAVHGWGRPDAVGHRIVHGGPRYSSAVRIDADVERHLRALTDLAPLHQPKSLAALDAVTALLPDIPAVACFDTGFHATIPAEAATYAVPKDWRDRYGIRRYGFHGLAHVYCSQRAADLLDRPVTELRIVTCHLGAGASLAAVHHGRSVDTTMGFTPLEGLVMATRSGTVDPGLVLWLEEHERLSPREIAVALEERSGLLALAGTADMREVEARAERQDPDATLALDVYLHRLAAAIAAMSAAMGGLDAVTFSGGVGEHSPVIRARIADRLGFLGLAIDAGLNAAADSDTDVTAEGAPVSALVITAREDLQIARETRSVFGLRAVVSGRRGCL